MAKKKSNYMSEKRFSVNDLILMGCLLVAVMFASVCLYGINYYSSKKSSNDFAIFGRDVKEVSNVDIYSFYEDKVIEEASNLVYGDSLYYAVTDINSDGIEDLAVKYVSDVVTELRFYTFDEDAFDNSEEPLVFAGSIGGSNGLLYKNEGDNFAVFIGDSMYYIYLENNNVTTFPVKSDTNPSRDNLVKFYSYKELNALR